MRNFYPQYRRATPLAGVGASSVGDERVQIELVEPLPAAEKGQLDDEAGTDDDAPQLLDEALDGLDGSARREHVVVDHDLRTLRDQLRMQLEGVLAVLEHVARAHG